MENSTISTVCIYCGQNDFSTRYSTSSLHGESYAVCRCRRCHAWFLNPTPTAGQLRRAYDDSYYGGEEAKFSPLLEKGIDYFRRSRSRTVRRYVSPPARVLDIGCGNGRFLGYLIEQGYEGYGIELPGRAAERAGRVKGLQLKVGPLGPDDFPEGHFDAITLWHVLEHLPHPRQTLDTLQRILKPGGFLIISMPNICSWQSRVFGGQWFHLDPPRHLFFMDPRALTEALGALGFRPQRVRHFSLEQNPFGIQQSLLNCLCRKREVLFESLKGNREYTAEYSRLSLGFQKAFYLATFPVFAGLAVLEAMGRAGGTIEAVYRKQEPFHVQG